MAFGIFINDCSSYKSMNSRRKIFYSVPDGNSSYGTFSMLQSGGSDKPEFRLVGA
jgi:hypothetical protein